MSNKQGVNAALAQWISGGDEELESKLNEDPNLIVKAKDISDIKGKQEKPKGNNNNNNNNDNGGCCTIF